MNCPKPVGSATALLPRRWTMKLRPQPVSAINIALPAVAGLCDPRHLGHLLGYARVSTADQQPHLQVDELERAGGTLTNRPPSSRSGPARPGDSLVVWKLDRLGRSLRHRVDIVTGLAARGVGFRSLQEQVDTTSPGGTLVFPVFAALAEFERTSSASAPAPGWPPPATRPPRAAAGRRR
jgi:hypothetical protein